MDNERKIYFSKLKRIVVKIGTSTLTHETGLLDLNRMESIVRQLANLHNKGLDIVIVSSGAIGAGMGKLGITKKINTIPEKQAAAAVGQGILVHMYEKLFSEYGKTVAQMLLTKNDMANRSRFLNARNTFFALFKQRTITIVNENDAVAVDEIKFGDNDTLSALVTNLVDADLLILLSDIDGLYDSDPRINNNAKLIYTVKKIDDTIKNIAGDAGTKFGTGGMITKINAAEIATASGTCMLIVNGSTNNIINRVLDGEMLGTLFKVGNTPLQAKKMWIAYNTKIKGKIIVDEGAQNAIVKNHKSLLAAGIKSVEGSFNEGDVVSVVNSKGKEFARGITNYCLADVNKIKGINSCDIINKLGYKSYDEVIHINNLAIIK